MSSLDLTEAQIAVHWKEEGYLQPPKKFIEQANLKDPDVLKRFATSSRSASTSNEVPPGSRAGNICIRNPWPGIMQTIWKDPDRFVKTYYAKYNKNPKSKDWRDWPYFAGDGAVQAPDGYFRILGRVDDVINVAGHRLGTKELESACLMVPEIAEAAVVPVADEARGRVPDVYVALEPGIQASEKIEKAVVKQLETLIGKIARPKSVRIVPDMPKTRSGKIMRRVLAAISNRMPVGDVTTLANPESSSRSE
jgi:acetyl-CoA synthetase